MNDTARAAKIKADADLRSELIGLLKHPVYAALIVTIIIEELQRRGMMGSVAGTTVETAALIHALPEQTIGDISGTLKAAVSLIPLLIK